MMSLYICYFGDLRVNERNHFNLRYLSDDLKFFSYVVFELLLIDVIGLGIDQMQTSYKSLRPHRIHQHSHRLPRWFPLRLRR